MLPFSQLTDYQLSDLLESTEKNIKRKLEDTNFYNFIKSRNIVSETLTYDFKYYNIDEYSNDIKKHNINNIIWHQNIRSIDKHFGHLVAYINLLQNPSFTCLTEIGRKNVENRKAQLKKLGYDMEYEAPQKVRGGVAIICKQGFDLDPRNDLKMKKPPNSNILDFENIWYETFIPGIGPTVIGVIYKHPNSTIAGLKTFKNLLSDSLEKVNKEKKCCIILGDINIDGMKISKNEVRDFFEMTLENNFIPIVSMPTRIQKDTCSTIDHIFINTTLIRKTHTRIAGNLYADLSDHLPNFLALGSKKPQHSKENRPKIRIFSEKNTVKFNETLTQANWNNVYNSENPNEALDEFYQIYHKAFDKCFPLKTLSRARARDKSWINPELRKIMVKKEKLYSKLLLNPSDSNKEKYNSIRNLAQRKRNEAENKYNFKKIENDKNNLKHLWDLAGTIVNPGKIKAKNTIKYLNVNKKKITGDKEIAEAMNNFFSSVGKNLASQVQVEKGSFKKYLRNKNPHTIELTETNEVEVFKIIMSLSGKKSCGDDNIRPDHLKHCVHSIREPVTHILNASIRTGIVPDKLKIAKVIPVYKKDERSDPSNYRPISLLSILDKILEKIICKRLVDFLEKHRILYKFQFGFRPKHSTIQAVTEIVDNIIEELKTGNLVAGIYMDLSKAFDTVDHKILLHKCKHYGIRGLALKWLKSYLENRMQYTLANGVKSSKKAVEYGVPQGSVLGPLLFLIYVNDIAQSTDSHKLRLFADDSNVFVTAKNPATLKSLMNEVVGKMCEWFKANKLTVNAKKTQFSIFTQPNKNVPQVLNSIKVLGKHIKRSESAKYLGIHLDDKLKWQAHIDDLAGRLTKTVQAFKIIKNYMSPKHKLSFYFAYIYSRIQYGIELYGSACQKSLKKIQIKQNRALKVLFNKEFRTPTLEMHKELKLLMVKDIAKVNLLKFVHQQRNDALPDAFENYYSEVSTHHSRDTRQKDNLHVNRETVLGRKSTKYRGAVQWNSISKDIRNCQTTKCFAKNLKCSIIDNY